MSTITVFRISAPGFLTEASIVSLRNAHHAFLQTTKHPAAKSVLFIRPDAVSMDDLYESAEDFDALNRAVAQRLLDAGDCVYGATGSISGSLLPVLREMAGETRIRLLPGISCAEAAFPMESISSVWTPHTIPERLNPAYACCVEELDSAFAAGNVKLALMEYYPEEWTVTLADLDAGGAYLHTSFPLFELDRQPSYSAAAVLYVPPVPFEALERFGYEELCAVMRRLRAPGGCPWDREQTHESLKVPLMEECYELLDAIDEKSDAHMTEELGDVLMQVVFHDEIAAEQGRFTDRDVTTELVKKLIFRHPHVFSDAAVQNSADVLVSWEKLKKVEKGQKSQTEVMKSVPRNLPALTRSKKIQKKAADVGFDWDNASDALKKVYEEADEVRAALAGDGDMEEELGDLLFAAVNVARLAHCDPELTLLKTCDKFINRFAQMEALAISSGKDLSSMTLSQQDELWNQIKNHRK